MSQLYTILDLQLHHKTRASYYYCCIFGELKVTTTPCPIKHILGHAKYIRQSLNVYKTPLHRIYMCMYVSALICCVHMSS